MSYPRNDKDINYPTVLRTNVILKTQVNLPTTFLTFIILHFKSRIYLILC